MTVEPEYRPFVAAGQFRWRLGLRPLDLSEWIQIGPDYDAEMAEKDAVLAAHPATVFRALPGAHDASAELVPMLAERLVALDPRRFSTDGDTVTAGRRTFTIADLHPLDLAGRLVQEDIALLILDGDDLVFGGGSICFPNRWDLASKLGLRMSDVHRPVAQLNEQLEDPIDRFFRRLSPERSYWRLGWTVLDTPVRYQPVDGTAPAGPPTPSAEHLHLRVERETLRRLPESRAVVFTIRTYIRHLSDIATDPDDGARLAAALRELPGDVAEYKGLGELGPMAVDLLDELVASAS